MTILDFERRNKKCQQCHREGLIFITYAPRIRPAGITVAYRCKPCAVQEAGTGDDPIEVVHHIERRGLPKTWERNKVMEQPDHLRKPKEPSVVGATAHPEG